MNNQHTYPGKELALFEDATNWKQYLARLILPLLRGRVLESGAGIGGTTQQLNKNVANEWVILEPDLSMYQVLQERISNGLLPKNCLLKTGTIIELDKADLYDCIIYIDVLEHISDDAREIEIASRHMKPGGYLIVLSPAFNFLLSKFDKSVGHYRRYTKKTLEALRPTSLSTEKLMLLDSAGFFASLANKLFLKQSYPTRKQVQWWDKRLIPVSKITDRIFFYSLGKSILAVWKKKESF